MLNHVETPFVMILIKGADNAGKHCVAMLSLPQKADVLNWILKQLEIKLD